MDSQEGKFSGVKFLTSPKWIIPASLFVAVLMVVLTIFYTKDSWALGSIFDFGSAEAETVTEGSSRSVNGPSKFGVNTAVAMYDMNESAVKNVAALTGPGGTIVSIIYGIDEGFVSYTKAFIEWSNKYCLTPVIRVSAYPSPNELASFFASVGNNGGKLVISIGNEVNYFDEWGGADGYSGDGAGFAKYLYDSANAIHSAVPGVKVIGSPLNTSAPCPGNAEYTCWTDFVDEMNNSGVDWKNAVDGHASNPYPVEYSEMTDTDGLVKINDRIVNYWVAEMKKMGYYKAVYIMETGPHNGTNTSGPDEFMSKYWQYYCNDGNVAMVNFFNGAGNSTDSTWGASGGVGNFVFTGSEVTDEQVTGCSIESSSIRVTDFGSCTIVDRSEYSSMGLTSGSRCISDYLTELLPETYSYNDDFKVVTEVQTVNGYSEVYGKLSITGVSAAMILESLEIEYEGDAPMTASTAVVDNPFDILTDYELISYYPADGRYSGKVASGIEAWLDIYCAEGNTNNQKASSLGLPWPVIPLETYSWRCASFENVSPNTKYTAITPEPISYSGFIYYPLGTALGAIVEDPYNYFWEYTLPSDFETDNSSEEVSAFVGVLSASVEYGYEKLGLFDKLKARFEDIVEDIVDIEIVNKVLSALSVIDEKVEPLDDSSIGAINADLSMTHYYTSDSLAGESGVEIATITYKEDCDEYQKVFDKYDEVIEELGKSYEVCNAETLICKYDPQRKDIYDQAVKNQGKVKRLLEQCLGEGGTDDLRNYSIQGELSLSAPFIPILAYERLQDVILSRDAVCDKATESILGAEVTATLDWYDAMQGGGDGVSYQTCDHTGAGVGGLAPNLLTNGSFEERSGIAGGTAAGTGVTGWTFAWKKNYDPSADLDYQSDECAGEEAGKYFCKAPEFKSSAGTTDMRRLLDGETTNQYFTTFNSHEVMTYQTVNVSGDYKLFGYFQGWRQFDDAFDDDGVVTDHSSDEQQDPNCVSSCVTQGKTQEECEEECQTSGNATSSNVGGCCVTSDLTAISGSGAKLCVYPGNIGNRLSEINPVSKYEIPMDRWDALVAEIETVGTCVNISSSSFQNAWYKGLINNVPQGEVSVVLISTAALASRFTDDYWDNVCLIEQGAEAVTKFVDLPSGSTRGTDYAGSSSSSSCEIYDAPEECICGWDVGTSDPIIYSEEMEFYIPGLGAIEYFRERVSTGSAKSIDTIVESRDDMQYCVDRSEGTMVGEVEYKCLSPFDVYIIQNLEPYELAVDWTKAICPNMLSLIEDSVGNSEVSFEEVVTAIKNSSEIEANVNSKSNSDYNLEIDLEQTQEEIAKELIESSLDAGFSRAETAYVLGTALIEANLISQEEWGCCDHQVNAVASRCQENEERYNVYPPEPTGCLFDFQWYDNLYNVGDVDGDGNIDYKSYYGRGLIQLTLESNYSRMGALLGPQYDLLKYPELALVPEVAAKIMVLYLENRGIRAFNLDGSYDRFYSARVLVNGDTPDADEQDLVGTDKDPAHKVAVAALEFYEGELLDEYY